MTGMCNNPNAPNGTMCTSSGSPGVCSVGACTLCGNNIINMGEQCDDGNSVDGDGCSATCQYEEIEPNNTCAIANTIALTGSPLAGSITGAITPTGDQDWYSFTIPAPSPKSVKIETNIGGVGQCVPVTGSADTEIFLYASNCTSLLGSNDDGGVAPCSRIDPATNPFARSLLPGTYKVRTIRYNNTSVINQYVLSVSVVGTCGNNTVEPGEACDDGDLNPGDGCNGTCGVENGFTCSGSPSNCFPNEINCNDGLDNNGSGAADAADPSCAIPAYFPACAGGQHLLVYPMPAETAIPATPAVLNSDITVSGATQVARAAIVFNAAHPYDGDIDLRLTPPGGMAIDMCTGNGAAGDNFVNTMLDSTCATNVTSGTAPFTGCYAPEKSLASLNGTSANGLWQLNINDNFPTSDFGTFNGWKLILCTSP
jgi:cysteine-rich repeat protein